MTYSEFKKIIGISKKEIYRRILETNRDVFRIKKEEKVIENLMKIFDATLEISNKKGFRAMSIRDLSGKSGLSTGALYSYFSSKDELLHLIQMQGRGIANKVLQDQLAEVKGARKRMQRAIQAHLHLSEIMQPWFYFTYIEARNLCADEQRRALESELYTEKIFMDILEEGIKEKVFRADNVILTAAIIKAMLQDWYLKRWKYRKRKVSVDDYKKFIIEVIEAYIIPGNSGV